MYSVWEKWTAWREAGICENPHGFWTVVCLNLPTAEFYWAVGAVLFLWYGPDVLTCVCNTPVRLFATRPHHRGRLAQNLSPTFIGTSCDQSELPPKIRKKYELNQG